MRACVVFILGVLAGGPVQAVSFFRLNSHGGRPGNVVTIPEHRVPGSEVPLWVERRTPFSPIRAAGGNFFFTESGDWVTVSALGTIHFQGPSPGEPRLVGGNYFLLRGSSRIFGVDADGLPLDSYTDTGPVLATGANWLIGGDGVLVTFKRAGIGPGDGVGFATRMIGWDFRDVEQAGGNYFIRSGGRWVTINARNGLFTEHDQGFGTLRVWNGNALQRGDGRLITVDQEGGIHLTEERFSESPEWSGGNAWRLSSGEIGTVDEAGRIHREILRIPPPGRLPVRCDRFYDPMEARSVNRYRIWREQE
jgi:hypothetical protein